MESKMIRYAAVTLLLATLPGIHVTRGAQTNPIGFSDKDEAGNHSDEKMKWWREARFGLFIHFGTYSVLGGVWKGKDYSKEFGGASTEHIKRTAKISDDEYVKVAEQFNPTKFNAAEWVSLAKAAGMKYIVITAKHAEGFAMFDTKYTDFNIMKASPFKRDFVKELADECHKQGMPFGVYYNPSLNYIIPKNTTSLELAKEQVAELMTNYGDISLIWFDHGSPKREVGDELGAVVRKLQPQTIISGRLYAHNVPLEERKYSDYDSLGDRAVAMRRVDQDTECPMTTDLNWGYAQHDDHCKSVKKLIEYLVVDVSHGANMLLNVGPKPDGTFTVQDADRLKGIGKWMQVNGESIYDTKASPMDYDFAWGLVTQNPQKKRLYLHVLKWNPKGIELTGLMGEPSHAFILGDPSQKELAVARKDSLLTIQVPEKAPDENDSVIVLEFPEGVKVDAAAKSDFHWQPTPDKGLSTKNGGKVDEKEN